MVITQIPHTNPLSRCNVVEPAAFAAVEGIRLGLTPAARKQAASSDPATRNDAVELVAPALATGAQLIGMMP